MTERSDGEQLPQATVVRKKRTRISVVWIIPILAAVVAVGIAVQRTLSEGPTISIVFKAAEGIEAGKTFIKYKDVNIGQVTSVELSDNYSRVTVNAKMAKSAAGLMVKDAKFWVVEPRITLSGVSGLSTLLSGNYIGFEAGSSDSSESRFTGAAVPPIITGDQPGRPFVLKASNLGSLGIGSPIFYRRLQAGQVVGYGLAEDGQSVEIKIFVHAPYDRYVTSGTRFWNASGFDMSIGAGGVDLRTESVAALIAGGLAFETPPNVPNGEPAAANAVFSLYGDKLTATAQPESVVTRYVLYFTESLRGLSVGAPATLLGLEGGTVTDVGLDLDPKTLELRGRVELMVYPERIIESLSKEQRAVGESITKDGIKRQELIRRMIEERGLRAQLRSGSLLTGQLYVAFEYFPTAPKVKVDWRAELVELPVMASTLPHLEQRITSIMAKIDAMPLAEIGDQLKQSLVALKLLLKDTDRAVKRIDADVTPELRKALEDFRRATVSADKMISNTDATLLGPDAPGQQDLREALREVTRAARSLRALTDYLERHPEALVRGKN